MTIGIMQQERSRKPVLSSTNPPAFWPIGIVLPPLFPLPPLLISIMELYGLFSVCGHRDFFFFLIQVIESIIVSSPGAIIKTKPNTTLE